MTIWRNTVTVAYKLSKGLFKLSWQMGAVCQPLKFDVRIRLTISGWGYGLDSHNNIAYYPDTMEFELANCSRFLDVSEFILLCQKESPMLRPGLVEPSFSIPKVNTTSTFYRTGTSSGRSVMTIGHSITYEYSPSVEALSDVDFVTPYNLDQFIEQEEPLSEFELDMNDAQYPYGMDYSAADSSDSPMESEVEAASGVDILDAMEQHYERQLSMTSAGIDRQMGYDMQTNSITGWKSDAGCEMDHQSAPNNYNWLTYKENNIEYLTLNNHASQEYLMEDRKAKVERYLYKRSMRNWGKKISYICRKQVADARLRVKGRFVTRLQASEILGMDTSEMPLDLIKSLIEARLTATKDVKYYPGDPERK